MPRPTLSRRAAARFIRNTKGLLFSVVFVKRTSGEKREMLARTGVKKFLKGGPAPYVFSEHGLVPVFDVGLARKMRAEGLSQEEIATRPPYRSIPLENITKLKIAGKWYTVE